MKIPSKHLRRTRRRPINEEAPLQIQFARWLDNMPILYCASAGGMRTTRRVAGRMKAMGYKKGHPDIIIYESRGKYHGMAVELKSKGGSARQEQKKWRDELQRRGYYALIMPTNLSFLDGLDWLKNQTLQYLMK